MGNCSVREPCGAAPWHDEVSKNVIINGTVEVAQDVVPLAAHFNNTENVNVSMSDAGFVSTNPSVDNCWGLKADSQVFKLIPGFQQIRLDLVGPPNFRVAYAARCVTQSRQPVQAVDDKGSP